MSYNPILFYLVVQIVPALALRSSFSVLWQAYILVGALCVCVCTSLLSFSFSFLKYIVMIMLLQLSHFFSPPYPSPPCTNSHPPAFPHFSPWDIHISSSASTFLTLFLTSPCLFSTYYLCFLFPVSFPPILLSPSPLITLM